MFVSLPIVVWDLRDWTPERCNNYTFERVAQNTSYLCFSTVYATPSQNRFSRKKA